MKMIMKIRMLSKSTEKTEVTGRVLMSNPPIPQRDLGWMRRKIQREE